MNFIKEFLDEGRSRIKSRFFASFAFAFIAINWRELFYLAFAEVSAEDKIEYFDMHTDFGGYVLGPLILGAVIAAVLPFVNNFFHGIVSGQVSAVRSRDDEYAHQRLKKKNEWEAERNRSLELLVEKAEIEERADSIKDDVRREEVQESLRKEQLSAEQRNNLEKNYTSLARRLNYVSDEISEQKAKLKAEKEGTRLSIGGRNLDDHIRRKQLEINSLLSEKATLELEIERLKNQLS